MALVLMLVVVVVVVVVLVLERRLAAISSYLHPTPNIYGRKDCQLDGLDMKAKKNRKNITEASPLHSLPQGKQKTREDGLATQYFAKVVGGNNLAEGRQA